MALPSELNPSVKSRTQGSAFAGPSPDDPTLSILAKKPKPSPAPEIPRLITREEARQNEKQQKAQQRLSENAFNAQSERTLDMAGVQHRQVAGATEAKITSDNSGQPSLEWGTAETPNSLGGTTKIDKFGNFLRQKPAQVKIGPGDASRGEDPYSLYRIPQGQGQTDSATEETDSTRKSQKIGRIDDLTQSDDSEIKIIARGEQQKRDNNIWAEAFKGIDANLSELRAKKESLKTDIEMLESATTPFDENATDQQKTDYFKEQANKKEQLTKQFNETQTEIAKTETLKAEFAKQKAKTNTFNALAQRAHDVRTEGITRPDGTKSNNPKDDPLYRGLQEAAVKVGLTPEGLDPEPPALPQNLGGMIPAEASGMMIGLPDTEEAKAVRAKAEREKQAVEANLQNRTQRVTAFTDEARKPAADARAAWTLLRKKTDLAIAQRNQLTDPASIAAADQQIDILEADLREKLKGVVQLNRSEEMAKSMGKDSLASARQEAASQKEKIDNEASKASSATAQRIFLQSPAETSKPSLFPNNQEEAIQKLPEAVQKKELPASVAIKAKEAIRKNSQAALSINNELKAVQQQAANYLAAVKDPSFLEKWVIGETQADKEFSGNIGDIARGAGVAIKQIAPIAKGMIALSAATAEKLFGEGGYATKTKNWGLQGYRDGMASAESLGKETDDVTAAWKMAQNGDVGALVDWFSYGIGYLSGQLAESAAMAVIGGIAGTAAEPGVGTLVGAGGGAVAKGAVKEAAIKLVEKLIARETAKTLEKTGVKLTSEQAVKQIVKKTGSTALVGANAFTQELGTIFPTLVDEKYKKGQEISGGDLARVWGTGIVAGGLESLSDLIGLDVFFHGKNPLLPRSFVGLAGDSKAIAGLIGFGYTGALEGGTEFSQTWLERLGAQQNLNDESAWKDYINSSALGFLGGGTVGGYGGLIHGYGADPEAQTEQIVNELQKGSADIEIGGWEKWANSIGPTGQSEVVLNARPLSQNQTAPRRPTERLIAAGNLLDSKFSESIDPNKKAFYYAVRADIASSLQNLAKAQSEAKEQIQQLSAEAEKGGVSERQAAIAAAYVITGGQPTEEFSKYKFNGVPIFQHTENGDTILEPSFAERFLGSVPAITNYQNIKNDIARLETAAVEFEPSAGMPDMGGADLLRKIREGKEEAPEMPIIQNPPEVAMARNGPFKLQGKNTEERYQSAQSKASDLSKALSASGVKLNFEEQKLSGSSPMAAFISADGSLSIAIDKAKFEYNDSIDPEVNNRAFREEVLHVGDYAVAIFEAKEKGVVPAEYATYHQQKRAEQINKILGVAKNDKEVFSALASSIALYDPEFRSESISIDDVESYLNQAPVVMRVQVMSELLRQLGQMNEKSGLTESRIDLVDNSKRRDLFNYIKQVLMSLYRALSKMKKALAKASPEVAADLNDTLNRIQAVLKGGNQAKTAWADFGVPPPSVTGNLQAGGLLQPNLPLTGKESVATATNEPQTAKPPSAEPRIETPEPSSAPTLPPSSTQESELGQTTEPATTSETTTPPAPPAPPENPAPKTELPRLPRDLAGAKPRYAYGANQFALNFHNDIDKALYIIAQSNPSRRDADYLKFVMDATGMNSAEAKLAGKDIRASIKEIAKTSDEDTIEVPQSEITKKMIGENKPLQTPKKNAITAFTQGFTGSTVKGSPKIIEAQSAINMEGSNLQPRYRKGRDAYKEQIESIARNLDPEKLMPGTSTGDGAPIVTDKNEIVSGHGRIQSLIRAFSAYPERAAAYRETLIQRYPEMAGQIRSMKMPIVVTEMDVAESLAESNKTATGLGIHKTPEQFLRRLAVRTNAGTLAKEELAVADAREITDNPELRGVRQIENGDLSETPENLSTLQKYFEVFGSPQQYKSENGFTEEFKNRVLAALLANSLVGNEGTITDSERSLIAAVTDPANSGLNIKTLASALTSSISRLSSLRQIATEVLGSEKASQLDPLIPISQAIQVILDNKRSNQGPKTWTELVDANESQLAGMEQNLLTQTAKAVYQPIFTFGTSSKNISAYLTNFASELEKSIYDLKNHGGTDIFGESVPLEADFDGVIQSAAARAAEAVMSKTRLSSRGIAPTDARIDQIDRDDDKAELQDSWTPVGEEESKKIPGYYSLGLFVPSNLAPEQNFSIRNLVSEVGPIPNYVSNELGIPLDKIYQREDGEERLSAEALETIALAINQIDKGKGLIIGHEMGVGKGRIVGSLIAAYATRKGLIPVFVTKSEPLYPAMLDDIEDVGFEGKINPLITNNNWSSMRSKNRPVVSKNPIQKLKITAETKKLPSEHNAIFTTYAQISSAAKKEVLPAINAIADRAIFILDESHNAAGVDSSIGEFFRGVIPKSRGAVFSSATAIKTPANIATYFPKTSIPNALPAPQTFERLAKRFGNPFMQMTSSMLARAGQMLRYQSGFTWKGQKIPFVPTPIKSSKEVVGANNAANEILGEMRRVEIGDAMKELTRSLVEDAREAFRDKAKDMASLKIRALVYPLSGQFHNVAANMVLGAKIKDTADLAEAEIKSGRKVFISMDTTGEAFLRDAKEIMESDSFNVYGKSQVRVTFKDFMERYARKLNTNKIKVENEETGQAFEFTCDWNKVNGKPRLPSWVSDKTIQAHEAVQAQLSEVGRVIAGYGETLTKLPISPFDALRAELQRRQILSGEISGRDIAVTPSGEFTQRSVSDQDKQNTLLAFRNTDQMKALVVSRTGTTGLSAHDDPRNKSSAPRTHIVMQPSPDIVDTIQVLGRTNRNNQQSAPKLIYLYSEDIPAETRIMAMTQKKMRRMGASTTGKDVTAASEALGLDMINKYGDLAAAKVLTNEPELVNSLNTRGATAYPSTATSDPEKPSPLEIQAAAGEAGEFIRRLIHKALVLDIDDQKHFFEELTAEYVAMVDFAKQNGTYELESQEKDYKAEKLSDEKAWDAYGVAAGDELSSSQEIKESVAELDENGKYQEYLEPIKSNNPLDSAEVGAQVEIPIPENKKKAWENLKKFKIKKTNSGYELLQSRDGSKWVSSTLIYPTWEKAILSAQTRLAYQESVTAESAEKRNESGKDAFARPARVAKYRFNNPTPPPPSDSIILGLAKSRQDAMDSIGKFVQASETMRNDKIKRIAANPKMRSESKPAALQKVQTWFEKVAYNVRRAGELVGKGVYFGQGTKQIPAYVIGLELNERFPHAANRQYLVLQTAGFENRVKVPLETSKLNHITPHVASISSSPLSENEAPTREGGVNIRELPTGIYRNKDGSGIVRASGDRFADGIPPEQIREINAIALEEATKLHEAGIPEDQIEKRVFDNALDKVFAKRDSAGGIIEVGAETPLSRDEWKKYVELVMSDERKGDSFAKVYDRARQSATQRDQFVIEGNLLAGANFVASMFGPNVPAAVTTFTQKDGSKKTGIVMHHSVNSDNFVNLAKTINLGQQSLAGPITKILDEIVDEDGRTRSIMFSDGSYIEAGNLYVPDKEQNERKDNPGYRPEAINSNNAEAVEILKKIKEGKDVWLYRGPRSGFSLRSRGLRREAGAGRAKEQIVEGFLTEENAKAFQPDGVIGKNLMYKAMKASDDGWLSAGNIGQDELYQNLYDYALSLQAAINQRGGKDTKGNLIQNVNAFILTAADNRVKQLQDEAKRRETLSIDAPISGITNDDGEVERDESVMGEFLAAKEAPESNVELYDKLERAMATLSDSDRKIFMMYVGGASYQQIAETPEAIKSRNAGNTSDEATPNKVWVFSHIQKLREQLASYAKFLGIQAPSATSKAEQKPDNLEGMREIEESKGQMTLFSRGLLNYLQANAGQSILYRDILNAIANEPDAMPSQRNLAKLLTTPTSTPSMLTAGLYIPAEINTDPGFTRSYYSHPKTADGKGSVVLSLSGLMSEKDPASTAIHEYIHGLTVQIIKNEVGLDKEMNGKKMYERLTEYANRPDIQVGSDGNPLPLPNGGKGAYPALKKLIKAYILAVNQAKDSAGNPVATAVFETGTASTYDLTLHMAPYEEATGQSGIHMKADVDSHNTFPMLKYLSDRGLSGPKPMGRKMGSGLLKAKESPDFVFLNKTDEDSLEGMATLGAQDTTLVLTPSGIEKLRSQGLEPLFYASYKVNATAPIFQARVSNVQEDPAKLKSIYYGLGNIYEFAAELFSDKDFQIQMMSIPGQAGIDIKENLKGYLQSLASELPETAKNAIFASQFGPQGKTTRAAVMDILEAGSEEISKTSMAQGQSLSLELSAIPSDFMAAVENLRKLNTQKRLEQATLFARGLNSGNDEANNTQKLKAKLLALHKKKHGYYTREDDNYMRYTPPQTLTPQESNLFEALMTKAKNEKWDGIAFQSDLMPIDVSTKPSELVLEQESEIAEPQMPQMEQLSLFSRGLSSEEPPFNNGAKQPSIDDILSAFLGISGLTITDEEIKQTYARAESETAPYSVGAPYRGEDVRSAGPDANPEYREVQRVATELTRPSDTRMGISETVEAARMLVSEKGANPFNNELYDMLMDGNYPTDPVYQNAMFIMLARDSKLKATAEERAKVAVFQGAFSIERREIARALGMVRDVLTPEERNRFYLESELFRRTPDADEIYKNAISKNQKKAMMEYNSEQIAILQQEVASAKSRAGQAYEANQQWQKWGAYMQARIKEFEDANKLLAETLDKEQTLRVQNENQIKALQDQLAKAGTSLEQMDWDTAQLKIREGKYSQDIIESVDMDENDLKAIRLVQAGMLPLEAAKEAGIKPGRVMKLMRSLNQSTRDRMRQVAKELAAQGLTRNQLREKMIRLSNGASLRARGLEESDASEAPLTEEEILDEIVAMLGFDYEKQSKPTKSIKWWNVDGKSGLFDWRKPSNVTAAMEFVRKSQNKKTSLGDAIFEAHVSLLVSSTSTQLANASKTIFAPPPILNPFYRAIEAGMAYVFGKAGVSMRLPDGSIGNPYSTIGDAAAGASTEAILALRAIMPSIVNGLKYARLAFNTEQAFYNQSHLENTLIDEGGENKFAPNEPAIPGKIGKILRLPFRALTAADEFSKSVTAETLVGSIAFRIGKAKGLKGDELVEFVRTQIGSFGSDSWKVAVERSARETLNEEVKENPEEPFTFKKYGKVIPRSLNKISGGISAASAKLEDWGINSSRGAGRAVTAPIAYGGSLALQILRGLTLFARISYNVMNRGMAYTPVGLADSILGTYNSVKKDRQGNKYIDLASYENSVAGLTEGAIGTILLMALFRSMEGDKDDDKKWLLLTGPAAEADSAGRTTRYGHRSYMIRIGDKEFDISRIEPFASMMGFGIALGTAVKDAVNRGGGLNITTNLLEDFWRILSQKTFGGQLRTLREFSQFNVVDPIVDFASVFTAPPFARGFIEASKDYVTRTKSEEPTLFNKDRMIQKFVPGVGVAPQITGYRSPYAYDYEGKKIAKPFTEIFSSKSARAIARTISPISVYKKKNASKLSRFVEAYNRMQISTDGKTWILNSPRAEITDPYTQKKVRLTLKEQETLNSIVQPQLEALFESNITEQDILNPTDKKKKKIQDLASRLRNKYEEQIVRQRYTSATQDK